MTTQTPARRSFILVAQNGDTPMPLTTRIRWDKNPTFATVAISGYVGEIPEAMFAIFSPDGFDSEWLLTTDLPGMSQKRFHASDPDGDSSKAIATLKAEAEEWLAAFAASIGATFQEA